LDEALKSRRIRVLCIGGVVERCGITADVREGGYRFLFQSTAVEGVDLSREHLLGQDCILLLPQGDGLNLIERLPFRPGEEHLRPWVVVTPDYDLASSMELLRRGVEEVIPGPQCTPERLRHGILSAVTRVWCKRSPKLLQEHDPKAVEQKALQTLDRLPFGVLFTDQTSRVLFMNSAAKRTCSNGSGLYLSAEQRCCARDPDQSAALQRLIRQVAQESESQEEGRYTLKISGDAGVDTSVLVVPVGSDGFRQGAALFLYGGGGFFDIRMETLQLVYGLTVSEAELLLQLVQGETLAEIALAREVTQHTVRAQLKSIFSKTGTKRQASLIKKVLTGPAVLMNR
jgi:DNA-binding NarL/FixJ family response regulator